MNDPFASPFDALNQLTLPKETPVGNDSSWPSLSWGNGGNPVFSSNYRKSYISNRATGTVALIYANSVALTPNISKVSVRASIEYPAGVFTPVTFRGLRDGIIDGGQLLQSDFATVGIPANTQFWVRTYSTGADQPYFDSTIVHGQSAQGEGSDAAYNTGQPDLTLSGTISTNSNSGFYPFSVLGGSQSRKPLVGLMGDSIMAGLGDTTWQVTGFGFGRRAMNNVIPFLDTAVSGSAAQSYTSQLTTSAVALKNCSYLIDEIGINDMRGSGTAATVLQGYLVAQAKLLQASNTTGKLKIYRTTYLPVTSSSDNWATTANQSAFSYETQRLAMNAWIRAGLPLDPVALTPVAVGTSGALLAGQSNHPYAGILDIEPAVSALNGSVVVWKVGYVFLDDTFGLHPNSTGHAAIAAVVQSTVNTWS